MPHAPPPGGRRAFFIAGRDAAGARSLASRMGTSTADLLFPLLFPPTLVSVTPSNGLAIGGTVVDLAGMNFRPGATATFGGVPATGVTFVSSSHITCTTPAHATGAVDVTVTNPDGASSTLVGGFTYFSLLIPDDADTIFHLFVLDGVVQDVNGNTITEVGTVPRVASQAMGFPNGKSAEGIGPFTTSDYFELPAGLFNFTDNFWVTTVVRAINDEADRRIVIGAVSGSGSSFQGFRACSWLDSSPTQCDSQFATFNNNTGQAFTSRTSNDSAIAVLTHARTTTGGSAFAALNQTAAVTSGGVLAMAPFTGAPRIGNTVVASVAGGAQRPYPSTIFEIRVNLGGTAPTAALIDALHTAIFTGS
jgi:hypothetical protein